MTGNDVFDLLKYTIPSIITFLTAYVILKLFIDGEKAQKELQLRAAQYKDSLPLRLQAYERLTLFLERITPTNMISRVNKPGMAARDLQLSIISNIRLEFEHNLSQQIYISSPAWMMIVQVKEEIISIVNRVASDLPEAATGKDLSRAIIEYFISNDQAMPTQKALDTIKSEAKKIF
ncbi:MAG: hypothetical protein H0V61_06905 [Chitinophagales bacterium]|nr:hypothetical protein [Chitinophagales bacterium]